MRSHRLEVLVSVFLIVATVAVFWQVRNHEFVKYDDRLYVTENSQVQAGLTREGFIWAFTTTHASNWHPLTWLSHMLDCGLYGVSPGGHHLTNLLFHVGNTLLLFVVFKRMTGAFWRSALVSALFALHPLHVESVAWVAERKDVLSTFFWMLTMWTYVGYVERPSRNRYLLVLLAFVLGLMSKPMLVTLPFALLLMDYWPLGRFGQEGFGDAVLPVVGEKVPFFALSLASSVVTFLAQQKGGTVSSLEAFPLSVRIANAVVSYVSYLGKMIWPHKLAVLYPLSGTFPLWQTLGCGVLLVCISVFVIVARHRFPYLVVGWLWYLGTLVPVIGLVQVGAHAMADRYTYVPLIGLFVIIAWGAGDLVKRRPHRRAAIVISAGVLLSAFMSCTWFQVRHWKNTITLFEHALDVTSHNPLAHHILGNALYEQGSVDDAIAHYSEALRLYPNFANAHNNLGLARLEQGRLKEAIAHLSQALQIDPNHEQARNNLRIAMQHTGSPVDEAEAHNRRAITLAGQGRLDEAIAYLLEALRIRPDYAEAHYNMGVALAGQGKLDEAVAHYSEALRLRPTYAEAHNNMGIALARQGKLDKAIAHFSEALRIKLSYAEARNNLARALRRADKAETEPNNFLSQ